ncbi:phospholipase D-like domain-containing protein [Desertivirga arenae]|uniref:phospholipase D-like domain-containing protein n=1 Tax=Desertivirga arenae TaxID=2810309 RepID=UPI001A95FAC4|nr:phospholipase D-like domain-containing protein [Pedobacter sp. SYSU D00823]
MPIRSHFTGIENILISEINIATESISVAVSWFVNHKLFNTLLKKASEGITIRLIIVNDDLNNRDSGLPFQKLIDRNIQFYFSNNAKLMHNKFCIIDSKKMFTGSYNWTYAAENNNWENVIELDYPEIIDTYKLQFENLIQNSDQVLNLAEFLKLHPPLTNTYDKDVFLNEEDLAFAGDQDIDIETRFLRAEEILVSDGATEQLKKEHKELKKKYSESVEALCRNYPSVFLSHVGERYPWTPELLEVYEKKIYPRQIQWNETVIWDKNMIRRFWRTLDYWATNQGSVFKHNRNIYLSLNELKEMPDALRRRYSDLKYHHPDYNDSTVDPSVPFYINGAFDGIPNTYLNHKSPEQKNYENDNYLWTEAELLEALPKLDTSFSRASKSIKWTRTLINKAQERNPQQFSWFCSEIYLTEDELLTYKEILDWSGIARNRRIDWTLDLFERYKDRLLKFPANFSSNESFCWSTGFINNYQDKLKFDQLSRNTAIPFDARFIIKYKDRWLYDAPNSSFSTNRAIPFDEYLLEELKEKWHWMSLAGNPSVPWTLNLINKYMPRRELDIFMVRLGGNKAVWDRILKPVIDHDFLRHLAPYIPNWERR